MRIFQRGDTWYIDYVYKGKRYRKRAGITDFRRHDCRHSFANHLVMSGASLKAVQQLLGHKDIKMTMRYSHLSQEHLQEAVNRLSLKRVGTNMAQPDFSTSQESHNSLHGNVRL